MVAGRVSIISPSRNERFLPETVRDLLSKAQGDIEIIVVLDGYWPNSPLPEDPRLRLIHRGSPLGMRPAINAAVAASTGEYLCKVDAHVMVSEGFDVQLKEDFHEKNWIVIPRRYALDPEKWAIEERKDDKYPIDAHYVSYPWQRPDDPTCGLHGTPWKARGIAERNVYLHEECSTQGSFWMMHREHWDKRIVSLDVARLGSFIQEAQELGMKTTAAGGTFMVNKKAWYAHLHKSKKHVCYSRADLNHQFGAVNCIEWWMHERPDVTRNLIERFWPVPTWPATADGSFDADEAFRPRPGLAAARFAKSQPDGVRVA